jgi:amidohydrolase
MSVDSEALFRHAEALADRLISFRHDLHRFPELSFQEERTAGKIEEALSEARIPTRRLGKTGVVADLPGSKGMEPCVALRADIDALPIEELTGLPYESRNPGVMHACGHDIHTSCLLGAGLLLSRDGTENAPEREGGIRLIFQPGEEQVPGGAATLIEEGVLENPRPIAILGEHIDTALPVGSFGFRKGPFMASVDDLSILVRGRGGHAAHPDRLADPVIASGALLVALQHLAGRISPPSVPSVLSIGKVVADGATNIVPDTVFLQGTFRTLSDEWREAAKTEIPRIAREITAAYGCTAEVEIRRGYPSLSNDPSLTGRAQAIAAALPWVEATSEPSITLGGEDFAYYAGVIPGCFYHLGVWEASLADAPEPLHSPRLRASDRAIPLGAATMAALALSLLEQALLEQALPEQAAK